MTRTCGNCDARISDTFYRVMYPEGAEIDRCPHCPDVRANGFKPNKEKRKGH